MKKIDVLMCCSDLSVQGGMVSVIKNYLEYGNWNEYNIIYIPTHIEKNKILVALYFLYAYFKINKVIKEKTIKIAHLHTAERGSFYRKAILTRSLKKHGIKIVMHHHAAEFELFYNNSSKKQKQYINETLELADLNIVLSKGLVSMIKSKAPNANVKVLYNAVPTYKFNPYNKEATGVLFLGRLGQRKGVYDLLNVIKKIDNIIDDKIKFYFCGDGDINNIKEKIKILNIEHRIEYIGWINEKEKKSLYPKIMINVLPSYNEGLPMSILETMAYGIPNISTNIASIPEVIQNGKNGFLIKPGDVETLSSTIIELWSKPELRMEFSIQAYELIRSKFSIDNSIERLKMLYSDLL